MLTSAVTLDSVIASGVADLPCRCMYGGHRFSIPIAVLDAPGWVSLERFTEYRTIACPECSGESVVDLAALGIEEC